MAIDAELFKLNKIDDAFHGQPSRQAFEWWYFDAIFDNGYSMVTSWHIGAMGTETMELSSGHIKFSIYDPDGKKTDTDIDFPANAVSASTKTCDVKMGNNSIHGEFPRYEIYFRNGDLGGNLFLENLIQGFRNPPDGVFHLSQEPPLYMGWAVAQPRARVTGKLTLADEEIPVNGIGYHDHNWGNIPLGEFYDHWYWGRLFLPNHTFIYSAGESSKSTGSQRICTLIAFKGEKLLKLSSKIDAEPSDFEADELTGAKYPRKLVLKIDASKIKGEVILKLKKLIERPTEHPEATQEPLYFRFLSDCEVKLDMDGEKIEVDTEIIHELMIP